MIHTRGFTLVELIAVMLVVSIGFIGLAGMFANMQTGLTSVETLQKTTKYANSCADYILRYKRDNESTWLTTTPLTSTMCNSLLVDTGYSFSLSFPTTTTGFCPVATITCENVTVTASGGGMSSTVIVTLVNY